MDIDSSVLKEEISRVVEHQSYNSTRQLLDSDFEQEILENLIDNNKPPYLKDTDNLDYLLKTPFRYPPLKYGSRFGTINEPGIFYGSLEINTALCETAYYRFRFLLDSEAKLRPFFMEYNSFAISINCKNGWDFTNPNTLKLKKQISNPISYKYSQKIGSNARTKGINAILYSSARTEKGKNMAVLSPSAFASKKVKKTQHWQAYIDYNTVTFRQNKKHAPIIFNINQFMIEDKFPIIS